MNEISPRHGIEEDEGYDYDNSAEAVLKRAQIRNYIFLIVCIVGAVIIIAVLLVMLTPAIGDLLRNFTGDVRHEPTSSVPETRVSASPIPAAPDYNYVLAVPEDDSVWGAILEAPFALTHRAATVVAGKEIVVLGGREADAPFPMTCTLPEYALVEQVGATVADGTSYLMVEFIEWVPPVTEEDPTLPTAPRERADGECAPGTLFQADQDVTF
jgi:hypothetical protein